MDEPYKNYIEQTKPGATGFIQYDSIYMTLQNRQN